MVRMLRCLFTNLSIACNYVRDARTSATLRVSRCLTVPVNIRAFVFFVDEESVLRTERREASLSRGGAQELSESALLRLWRRAESR